MPVFLGQGAEAILNRVEDKVIKARPVKSYRLSVIDSKLRKLRTRREARILEKLHELNVQVPFLLNADENAGIIEMSFVKGEKLRDVLDKNPELAKEIGRLVGTMHKNNIIHADLTTSNMIFNEKLHIIDFGLSFVSIKIEDKAVDLHVLDRALESRHHRIYPKCFHDAIEGYKETNPDSEAVLKHLKKVQSRGRNKLK